MNLDFLQKQKFWYFFVFAIIFSLFLYGLHMDSYKTELQKTKESLRQANKEIQNLQKENRDFEKSITTLKASLKKKSSDIAELEKRIVFLENIPPDTVIEYVTIYKEKPESYHRYGKGKGKLVVYKTCSNCQEMKVSIDGKEVGILTEYFENEAPNCYQSGTINIIVDIGNHHIECKDKHGSTWETYVTVKEDECFRQGFKN